ncbi:gustatory receptor for sugar taste 64a-like [Zophobas morio]|uniref:gustatory receptor for sugar taste 64a-like n=1 Tax=Zophobas morio TaxID=2755281 RepID=UPI003082E117
MSGTTESNKHLHKSLKFILIIAQVFGFFPVKGILCDYVFSLRYFSISARELLSLFVCVIGWLDCLANVRILINSGFNAHYLNGAVFSFSNATYFFLFLRLAREWPKFMKHLVRLENQLFARYNWPHNFDFNVKLFATIFLCWELVEHVAVQGNKIIVAINCKGSFELVIQHYLKTMGFRQEFELIHYSHLRGVILQAVNTCFACCWTYVDLFILLVSYYFTARFKQIRKHVLSLKNDKIISEKEWRDVREDHNQLCNICALFNKKLSSFILLSVFTNIYYMVFHIFRIVNVKHTTLEFVYFILSFGLLISRTIGMCWVGGLLFEETRAFLPALASTPTKMCNIEIDRFIEEVRCRSIGFTGKKFFTINKLLILKVKPFIIFFVKK